MEEPGFLCESIRLQSCFLFFFLHSTDLWNILILKWCLKDALLLGEIIFNFSLSEPQGLACKIELIIIIAF